MALFFFKPVVWNDQGYQRPGGGKFTSGYPAENGFGHEEWNNSDQLNFVQDGKRLHAFHTEGFGNQELDQFAGAIFVFMIASHLGKQFLVSVAGNATSLIADIHRKARLQILREMKNAPSFSSDAWNLLLVQKAFGGDRSSFERFWRKESQWFANWICPTDLYLGLSDPLELDPQSVTGRKRLVSMYGSYQEIDRPTALRILDRCREAGSNPIVLDLISACGGDISEVDEDIHRLKSQSSISETTKRRLIDARIGQGKFRAHLNAQWRNACAVTKCSLHEILRASHIKPWRSSSNKERLDPNNGLLLTAHLDALFDSGLISFDNSGKILRSEFLQDDGRPQLILNGGLRILPSPEMQKYLAFHRANVFRRNVKAGALA